MTGSGRIDVFILDDHEMVRRGLREMLAQAGGFEVVGESASAVEAFDEIRRLQPQVALLDVQLPDGSGIEVCRRLRSSDSTVRLLMVTTFDDERARLAAALAGAAGFVSKQIRGQELIDTVRAVAAGQQLLDPDAAARAVHGARVSVTAAADAGSERAVSSRVTPADRSAARPRGAAASGGRGDARLAALTGQEQRVLNLIADGLTNREIGERLGIGEKTVKNYVTSVLVKLGFVRRTQAAVFGAQVRGY